MLEIIKGVKNEAPFKYFEEISKIPRASGNEKEIANYLVAFAKAHGLDWYKDESNNVLIKKKATEGRESEETIMLQAHTDMVAEKNKGTTHDFERDPIKLICEGNILRADGTTLGADDGFGVAIMLAVLGNNEISHPEIECLFTSSEEVGLVGASSFDYSHIKSRRMVNLDSAEENTVIIGCCGGIRTELTMGTEMTEAEGTGIKITIGGLCGGHSGEDIDRGRLNSHILMGKLLNKIKEQSDLVISQINGGDKDNAIPRECEALILTERDVCLDGLEEYARGFIKADEDKGLFVACERVNVKKAISKEKTEQMLKILSLPNGVLHYRTVEPILPEASRNLARIRTNDNSISIGFSSRSYLESRLEESTSQLDRVAKEIGGTTYHHEKYPGWESPKDSDLVTKWQRAYNKTTGRQTSPTLIHAGLECGLMSAKLNGLVAISVGCNVHDLHTPKETMELDSMERIYNTVLEFLNS
ncbi:MAG: beta-Ala-His dipeptidase [Clostridia bacterium]|nr:beta-Ala-His dipeptidase [Clostridia bacterium]